MRFPPKPISGLGSQPCIYTGKTHVFLMFPATCPLKNQPKDQLFMAVPEKKARLKSSGLSSFSFGHLCHVRDA